MLALTCMQKMLKLKLQERTQILSTNEQLTGPQAVGCSVPQGSVLGQLKFIGYTEDLADLITNHQLSYHLYADDTQLLGSTSTSNIRSTVDRLQSCVAAIHQWCDRDACNSIRLRRS